MSEDLKITMKDYLETLAIILAPGRVLFLIIQFLLIVLLSFLVL